MMNDPQVQPSFTQLPATDGATKMSASKLPFTPPKLTFIAPKLTKQGTVEALTAGLLGPFSP